MIMYKTDHTIGEACAHRSQTAEWCHFGGFEHIYNKVLEVESQQLCTNAQAGNYYKELKNSIEHFKAGDFGSAT